MRTKANKSKAIILLCTALIFCLLFFFVAVEIIARVWLLHNPNTNVKSNVTQLLPAFDVHNPPLPPGWQSKENLPGNSFATAFQLNPGVKTQGTLNADNALDFYFFNLKEPSQIIIDVTDVPKTFSWILYDAQFKEVAYTLRSGTTEGSTKVTIQNPGKYYIRTWAEYGQTYTNFPYTIRLSVLPFFD